MSSILTTDIAPGLDKGWIMISAGFVFVMQIGLGLMEIGSIRRKHSRIVWYKILLNLIFCFFWWFLLGYAWAFGDNNGSFLGAERYYVGDNWDRGLSFLGTGASRIAYIQQYSHWVWRVAIASVATTIATAIVSERITMRAVFLFNVAFNMIILPFIFSWTFAFGFLVDDLGYIDFGGSYVVFGAGGVAGLAALLLTGPRYNRYGTYPVVVPIAPHEVRSVTEARPTYTSEAQRNLPSSAFDKLRGTEHYTPATGPGVVGTGAVGTGTGAVAGENAFTTANIIGNRKRQDEDVYEHFGITDYGLVILGALTLMIGFIFFNAGASQSLTFQESWLSAEKWASNTLLGAMGGGLSTLGLMVIFISRKKRTDRQTAVIVARAFVAGMVANAAAGYSYNPWAGIVVGICGATGYLIWGRIFYAAKWDDPAEFFAIFFGGGVAGVLAAAFLNPFNGIFHSNATEGEILIWQLLSLTILIGWTFIIAFICFALCKLLRFLRVGLKNEIVGYDYIDGARHLDFPDEPIHRLIKQKRI